MTTVRKIIEDLETRADPIRAAITRRFFKTNSGAYSEHDQFIGIRVPDLRKLAQHYGSISVTEVVELLHSPIHEQRHLALLIWVYQYGKKTASQTQRNQIYEAFLRNTAWINNWDLVDCSVPHIVGEHLHRQPREILHTWVESENMWERRMSVVSTWAFIKQQEYADTITIANKLLGDNEDLIQKAVGWMLREVGKRDRVTLYTFLDCHHTIMPRTMLRYSIERLPIDKKTLYMKRT